MAERKTSIWIKPLCISSLLFYSISSIPNSRDLRKAVPFNCLWLAELGELVLSKCWVFARRMTSLLEFISIVLTCV
jgi:hypothetical protein